MNPYAKYLEERDPLAVIAATAKELKRYSEKLGPKGMEKSPAPGKWSARAILCHLADCEIVFAYRLRQADAEDHHVIQPFDQDKWARSYAGYEAAAALNVFASVREWNVAFIKGATAEMLAKKVTHPERGTMSFQTIVETMAGHDLNHLGQMEGIVAKIA
jgi:uncharacterized damage-inducible protein DinB